MFCTLHPERLSHRKNDPLVLSIVQIVFKKAISLYSILWHQGVPTLTYLHCCSPVKAITYYWPSRVLMYMGS